MMQLHSRGLSVGAGMTGLHTTTLLPSFHNPVCAESRFDLKPFFITERSSCIDTGTRNGRGTAGASGRRRKYSACVWLSVLLCVALWGGWGEREETESRWRSAAE